MKTPQSPADHDHAMHEAESRLPLAPWTPDFRPTRLPQTVLLGLIRLYQLTLSRLMPPNTCRFYPSCSRYGFEAVRRHGAVRGGLLAAWRVLRCNPFNPGGYDPVP
jgi:putative membrane protein insertion efficiency factor